MRTLRLLPWLMFCCLICPLCAEDAPEEKPVPASPLKGLELNDGDSIVFLGDSITHQALYTQYVEDYLFTRFPKIRLKIHNAGVGGAKAWDALRRFEGDVAAYQPKYVTILLGMNDGEYKPFDQETFETYRSDMQKVLANIEELGATPILMTPTMFDARAHRLYGKWPRTDDAVALYNSVLAYYGTWLRDVAAEKGYGFVDMWSPLNNTTLKQRKTDPTFTLIKDAIHPGPDGQVIMAASLIRDLNFPREVSSIVLSKQKDGEWEQTVTGGAISDFQETEDGVSFTFEADSLPWVLPEDAKLGAQLAKIGSKLSRESLQISGLSPGDYSLTIDGTDVGTIAAEQLIRAIELQDNPRTPQHQQALEVAMLNKQRNETAVKDLRTLWWFFQGGTRTERQAKEKPDDAELQAKAEKEMKGLENISEGVAKQNARSQEMIDQIYELAQPKPRKYVLKRVK